MKYLAGYPAELLTSVPALIAQGRLARTVLQRYPEPHAARADGAFNNHLAALKAHRLSTCGRPCPPRSERCRKPNRHQGR